jgi:hypothetical protein
MPKVTLLSPAGTNYMLAHGVAMHEFRGQISKEVPVAVALICAKKKTPDGKECLFKVENLPEVVDHECVVPPQAKSVEQNVVLARQAISFVQPKLMGSEICL